MNASTNACMNDPAGARAPGLRLGLAGTLFAALLCGALPGPATAGEKAAIFPIELLDPGVIGGRQPRPDEARRLALATEQLREALAAKGGIESVDLAPQAEEIRKRSPLSKCEGCAATIAQALGAELAVLGYVEKGSNQIFNFNVAIADAGTGKVLRGGQVVIRADTDETWAHAVRSIVKNHLLAEPLPGRS